MGWEDKAADLREMLSFFATSTEAREGYRYRNLYDYVICEGKAYEPAPLDEDDVVWGEPKNCFCNATLLAMERDDLTYVEGYAFPGNVDLAIPLAHAWCVDEDGKVVDNTWEKSGKAYYGVAFATDEVARMVTDRGYYGVIDNWEGGWPLLKEVAA